MIKTISYQIAAGQKEEPDVQYTRYPESLTLWVYGLITVPKDTILKAHHLWSSGIYSQLYNNFCCRNWKQGNISNKMRFMFMAVSVRMLQYKLKMLLHFSSNNQFNLNKKFGQTLKLIISDKINLKLKLKKTKKILIDQQHCY